MRNITWYYHRKFAPETKLATSVHIIDLGCCDGKFECWAKRVSDIARAEATGKGLLSFEEQKHRLFTRYMCHPTREDHKVGGVVFLAS
jgi:hypothetical protein